RPRRLLDTAFQSWKTGRYTDVTILIGERTFPAHRLVLASLSDYFPPLLKFDEDDSGEVTLHNIEPDDFFVLLKYAYTGTVDINKENVQSVLIAADYLSVSRVRHICIKFMIANFDVENIIDVLLFGIEFNLSELISHSREFLQKNFAEVLETEGWSKLEPKFLETFFSDNDLVLCSNKTSLKSAARESLILKAVLKYLSLRQENDPGVVEMLIRTVRLPLVPADVVTTFLNNYRMLKKNTIIQKYLQLREVALKHIQERIPDKSRTRSPETSEIPDGWFRLRKHAEFSFVQRRRRYAAGGQIVPTPIPPESVYTDSDLEIKKVGIWLREWDNKTVVGGLALWHYNPAYANVELVYRKGNCPGDCQHLVELERGEYIVKVTVGSGFLIDRLGFETNQGRVFGPFGGPGGEEYTESCPSGSLSYLYDINCDAVDTQGSEAILNLVLRWITFS
ncbi:unnamed protein product, partial [Candidula unifasciata]